MLPLASFSPSVSVFDDSDSKSKHFYHFYHSQKTKLTKLPDPSMLTDGHATRFDINMWKSKMTKKLVANANHYPTKALRITYIDNCMGNNIYKHLAAKSKIGARKPFAMAEKMFKVLQKAYKDSNRAHTAANKFRDLKMIGDFNNFWVEFQVLASELNYSKATLIGKLKYKLTPSLFQAMADDVSRPKNIHEYAKQYQQTYQDLKNIE